MNSHPQNLRLTELLFCSLLHLIPILLCPVLGRKSELSSAPSLYYLAAQMSRDSSLMSSKVPSHYGPSLISQRRQLTHQKSGKLKIFCALWGCSEPCIGGYESLWLLCCPLSCKNWCKKNMLHLMGSFTSRDGAITQEGTSQCFAL